jgi:hypothetical protein
VQLRIDAQQVLNNHLFGNPILDVNNANFGQIPADQVTGSRTFQGQLRFNF